MTGVVLAISADTLVRWIHDYGYFAVFVPVFLETAGIPLPGETVMLLAGAAAAGGHINVFGVMVVGAVAAILGDNVGYLVGRIGGRRAVVWLAARIGRIGSLLGWGEQFFARHGGKTVFLARWTAGLRIFGAWIAGMTHMPWRTFFLWNAAGGITWSVGVVGLGYFFGRSLHTIERGFGVAGAILAGLVAVAVGGYLLHRLHHRQEARARAEASTLDPGD